MDYHHLGRGFYEEARRVALNVAKEADEYGFCALGEKFRGLPDFATLEEARFALCELRGALATLLSKRPYRYTPDQDLDRLTSLVNIVDQIYRLSRLD